MEKTKYSTEEAIPFWRDERVLRVLGQVVFIILSVSLFL